MARNRAILLRVALALGSAAISLLVAEALLRTVAPPRYDNHHLRFNEYDALLGWRHVPGGGGLFRQPEFEVELRYNSRGARGPEYPFERSPGAYRILIIGDSFAEGFSVKFEDLFSEVLAGILPGRLGRPVEVINLGTAGYSTDQELLLFEHEGRAYDPDLTVLVFHDNDIVYNARPVYGPWSRGPKPVFRLEGGALRLDNVPVPAVVEPKAPRDRRLRDRLKAALSDYSALFRWIRGRIKGNASLHRWAIALGLANPPGDGPVPMPTEFGVYRRVYEPEVEEAWEVTRALLGAIRDEVSQSGSDFLILHAPFQASVYPDSWERMKRTYGLSADEWTPQRVAEELELAATQLGIQLLQPIEPLRAQARAMAPRGRRLYFEDDGHWNAEGNRVIGDLLADRIAGLLRTADATP